MMVVGMHGVVGKEDDGQFFRGLSSSRSRCGLLGQSRGSSTVAEMLGLTCWPRVQLRGLEPPLKRGFRPGADSGGSGRGRCVPAPGSAGPASASNASRPGDGDLGVRVGGQRHDLPDIRQLQGHGRIDLVSCRRSLNSSLRTLRNGLSSVSSRTTAKTTARPGWRGSMTIPWEIVILK